MGIEALGLSAGIKEKFELILQQLRSPNHILNKVIEEFQQWFYNNYSKYYHGRKKTKTQQELKDIVKQSVKDVQDVVHILFLTAVKFHKVDLKANDVNKDVLINIITHLVLRKDTGQLIRDLMRMKNAAKIKEF